MLVGFLALPPALGLGLDQRGIVTVLGQPACSLVVCETLALTTYIDGVGLGHGVALILLLGVHAARVGRSRVIASHNGSTSPGDLVGRPARRGHPVGALVASVMTAGKSEPNRRLARPVPLLH